MVTGFRKPRHTSVEQSAVISYRCKRDYDVASATCDVIILKRALFSKTRRSSRLRVGLGWHRDHRLRQGIPQPCRDSLVHIGPGRALAKPHFIGAAGREIQAQRGNKPSALQQIEYQWLATHGDAIALGCRFERQVGIGQSFAPTRKLERFG